VIIRFPPSHYEKPEAKKPETPQPAAQQAEFSVPPQSCGQNPFRKNFDRRAERIQGKVMKNLAKLHNLHGNSANMTQHLFPHLQQLGQVYYLSIYSFYTFLSSNFMINSKPLH